jgi:molybdopterin synthase sulfur carrier subunit
VSQVTVRVRIPASLRGATAGRPTVEARLGAGGSPAPDVRALLDQLATVHPDLERRVRDEQGTLRRHVNLFVGPTNIRDLDEQATTLRDGDEVAILPAVAGGA